MAKAAARVYSLVDPMDRWVRVTWLADAYGEPASSLHAFLKEHGVTVRYNGKIAYANERHYQDALAKLPTKPNAPTTRGDLQPAPEREAPLPRQGERPARLRPLDAHQDGRSKGISG